MKFLNKILIKREVILLASLFLFSLVGLGQLYNFKKLSVEEGLSAHGVYSMCEGPKGKLWIGLEGEGVNVYDGWSVYRYNDFHLGKNIRVVFKDSKNNMWFGSEFQGISVVENNVLHKITTDDGLFVNHIRGIVEDENGVEWVATFGGGVSVIDEFKVVKNLNKSSGLPSSYCRTIFKGIDGSIWIGTDNGLVQIKEGKVVHVYDKKNGLPHNTILSVSQSDDGDVWIGTQKGLAVLKDGKIFTLDSQQKIKADRIKSVLTTREGDVWIGTKSGLGKIKIRDLVNAEYDIQWYDDRNGLSNNRVRCLYQDASRAIWIGTYFGGVNNLFNESFSLYNKSNGLHDNVITALKWNQFDSSLWIGSHDYGIAVWGKNSTVYFNKSNGLSENQINAIAHLDSGKTLVGTVEGVNLISNQEIQRVWDSYDGVFSGNEIVKLVSNGTEVLGLTNSNELFIIRDTGEVYLDTINSQKANNLMASYINSINEIEGSFYVGCDSSVIQLKLVEGSVQKINRIEIESVLGLVGDADELLGYTKENKLFKYVNDQIAWEKYFPRNNEIMFVRKSARNIYWVGLKNEVVRLKFTEGLGYDLKSFSLNEGFMGGASVRSAITEDENNQFYIGTIKGMLRVQPGNYNGVKRDLQVYLTGLLSSNNQIDWKQYSDTIINGIPINVVLPHKMTHLTFQYKSYHLKSPDEVFYKIDLKGEEEFIIKTNDTEKEFVDLSPGEYELIISAKTQWGDWSENPLVFKFEITPPFWKLKSFQVSVSVLVIGLIFLVFKLRTRKLEREKRKLEILVEERTKDLNEEKQKSENLLLNILPQGIANELKVNGYARTRRYDKASVLFTDFKGFTKMSSEMEPEKLVKKLDEIFMAFDEVIERNHLEKIKTIGDAYMCASGIPDENKNQVKNIVIAGLQLVEVMNDFNQKQLELGEPIWDVRVGIHTGELIAGVVGKKKFAYDVWGDTVNIASRMESNSEPSRVNVSKATMEEVKEFFEFEERGKIEAKNRGELEMYFVTKLKKEYCRTSSKVLPNKEFYS